MNSSKLTVVVGGQLGSEGKGAITAFLGSLAENRGVRVYGVRVAGPNAGHTVLGRCPEDLGPQHEGRCTDDHNDTMGLHPWRLRQVPVTAVTNPTSMLVIAAGSEIDPVVLIREIEELDAAGYKVSSRLLLDRSATIIEPEHLQAEREQQLTERVGSTGKGIGAARQARLGRTARTVLRWYEDLNATGSDVPALRAVAVTDTATMLNKTLAMDDDVHVVIEGTQGYGLGLHTDYYPQVTSSDCRAIDFLAMAGISPWVVDTTNPDRFAVWVVMRTYPIRVAGNSGPLRGETTWSNLGLPPEFTTVTRKERRVGDWDPILAAEAIRANGGGLGAEMPQVVHVALTMADHVIPELANTTVEQYASLPPSAQDQTFDLITRVAGATRISPTLIGTGPRTLVDLRTPTSSATTVADESNWSGV